MLPAADFESLDVRPSLSVFDAAFAAAGEVTFCEAFRWDSALPAEDFDVLAVEELESVFEALREADLDVISFLAMELSPLGSSVEVGSSVEAQPRSFAAACGASR